MWPHGIHGSRFSAYAMSIRERQVEDRPMRGREGLAALRTEKAPILARMDTNIPLAGLASGGTRRIGAECRCGVHAWPPSSVGERTQRSMAGPSLVSQGHLTT